MKRTSAAGELNRLGDVGDGRGAWNCKRLLAGNGGRPAGGAGTQVDDGLGLGVGAQAPEEAVYTCSRGGQQWEIRYIQWNWCHK